MTRLVAIAFLAVLPAIAVPLAAQPPAPSCPQVEVLASYPAPAFLENLHVEPSGRVLFTSYLAGEIIGYEPGKEAATFAKLDAFPISILPLGTGWLVAAHGASFTAGPNFTATNRLLMLGADGMVTRVIAAPEARFLNGMVQTPDGAVLVADSILGRIWKFDPETGDLTAWLDDPALAADPSGQDLRPGANGLKFHRGKLYVSNSFSGRIHALGITPDGRPDGAVSLVAEPGKIDDFAVAADGSIYLATHSDTILRVAPDGTLHTVLPDGGDGATAVAFTSPDEAALYALTTGGLLEGAGRPARLLRIDLSANAKPCET